MEAAHPAHLHLRDCAQVRAALLCQRHRDAAVRHALVVPVHVPPRRGLVRLDRFRVAPEDCAAAVRQHPWPLRQRRFVWRQVGELPPRCEHVFMDGAVHAGAVVLRAWSQR